LEAPLRLRQRRRRVGVAALPVEDGGEFVPLLGPDLVRSALAGDRFPEDGFCLFRFAATAVDLR